MLLLYHFKFPSILNEDKYLKDVIKCTSKKLCFGRNVNICFYSLSVNKILLSWKVISRIIKADVNRQLRWDISFVFSRLLSVVSYRNDKKYLFKDFLFNLTVK